MSRHPYEILKDLLEQARLFLGAESELVPGLPPGSPFRPMYPLHQIERSLAKSGGQCLHFWSEYRDRAAGMNLPPFPIHVSRETDEIAEAIRDRLLRWGWKFLLTPRGMKELDERLKAHRKTRYLPLLDAARSWRSARKVRKHLGADVLADEAIRLGVPPTMTPEEGERVIWELHREWYESPALGEDIPSFSSEEHEDLSRSIDVVSAYLRNLVPPDVLAETRERLEHEARQSPYPIPSIDHQSDLEQREEEADERVESTTRVLVSPA